MYKEKINDIITIKITPSKPISDLINDSLLQEWVREGIEKHKEKRDFCGFCGGILNNELWGKLDEHFNKESEELRNAIAFLCKSLKKLKKDVSEHINLHKDNFYVNHHIEFEFLNDKWQKLKSDYLESLDSLINELDEREKDIFRVRNSLNIPDLSDEYTALLIEINNLITKNNQRTTTLKSDQDIARKELRMNEISKFIHIIDYKKRVKEINQLFRDVESVSPFLNEKQERIDLLNNEKRKLESQLKDESRGADLVNKHLTNFFGHDELKLVAEGESTNIKFNILRDGSVAKNLSEGECSLISFCYFIAKVEDELKSNTSREKLIIYIDDPISSLDGNHIFFMYSLIEGIIAKKKNYLQLFISTHNLDFLKYLKRITVPNGNESINHYLIERKMKRNDKASFLSLMPSHIRDYVTEFNYLFSEIYNLYKEIRGDRKRILENTYNQYYNLPNNIRKFLECYLFYRYPNGSNPLDNLDKMFDGNVPSLINRVINEYSHLVYIDRGWKPVDVEEMEKCVEIILKKIEEIDPNQFLSLLDSIGVKRAAHVEIT